MNFAQIIRCWSSAFAVVCSEWPWADAVRPPSPAWNGPLSVRFLLFRLEGHLPSSSSLDPLAPLPAAASSSQSLPETPIPSNKSSSSSSKRSTSPSSVSRLVLWLHSLCRSIPLRPCFAYSSLGIDRDSGPRWVLPSEIPRNFTWNSNRDQPRFLRFPRHSCSASNSVLLLVLLNSIQLEERFW